MENQDQNVNQVPTAKKVDVSEMKELVIVKGYTEKQVAEHFGITQTVVKDLKRKYFPNVRRASQEIEVVGIENLDKVSPLKEKASVEAEPIVAESVETPEVKGESANTPDYEVGPESEDPLS